MIARYVYGNSDHVPGYVVKGGSTFRLLTDHLGSVRLVVNAGTGAVMLLSGQVTEVSDTRPFAEAHAASSGA